MSFAFLGLLLLASTMPVVGEAELENGLRILVLEDHSQPRVACKILTRFGAVVEEPGRFGSAHFLEHLMFKGTATIGTHDWEAEKPILDEILELERDIIQERNRARSEMRERGVYHDFKHAETTPQLEHLMSVLHEKIIEDERYVDTEESNSYYQRTGGTRLTAQTEQEYMKFDINLPSEKLEMFFRIEADRMVNSRWRRFDSEVGILWEQRLGDLNGADTVFKEAVASASGVVSPIYWNEGYETDFPILERNYTRRLYETWFVPNNTIIVLVGDTTLEEAERLTKKYFDRIPRSEETHDTFAVEPRPDHYVRVEMQTLHFGPALDIRHRIPGVGHPDRPAVELLGEILGDARGPIGAATVGEGLATSLASNTLVTHTNRFSFPATLNVVAHGSNLEALEPAIIGAMENLRTEQIADDVIRAAKKRRRAYWERRRLNWDDVAFDMGHYAIMDSWQTLFREMDALQEVTADELRATAKKYLAKTNRILGVATREPVQ